MIGAYMQRRMRAEELAKVHFWTNWTEYSNKMLSLPEVPKELLILFVTRSVRLARSLSLVSVECLPEEVIDEHIRAYLLEKVWSYHLLTERVLREIRNTAPKAPWIESKEFPRLTRKTVARLMLQQRAPTEANVTLETAASAALRSLKSRYRNLGTVRSHPASSSSHPDLSTNCTIAGRSARPNFSHARAR